jgi:hypothetical protein
MRGASRPTPHWERLPRGERYPYLPDRFCPDCAEELSRYNCGPFCEKHHPVVVLKAAMEEAAA